MLLAGEVGKPHGLGGEVYVVPISDDPHRFEPGGRVARADGSMVVIETSRRHGDRLVVKFEGIDDRDGAAGMRGPLFVPESATRALDEDEFWQHEVAGATVVDPAGRELGTVTKVVPGPAQDMLEVRTGRGNRLVPVVKNIVVSVDIRAQRVVIDAPEGLLE